MMTEKLLFVGALVWAGLATLTVWAWSRYWRHQKELDAKDEMRAIIRRVHEDRAQQEALRNGSREWHG